MDHAPETLRLYGGIYNYYEHWCAEHRVTSLPIDPDAAAKYLYHIAEQKGRAAMNQHRSAIATLHRSNGHRFDTKHASIQAVIRHPPARVNGRAIMLQLPTRKKE